MINLGGSLNDSEDIGTEFTGDLNYFYIDTASLEISRGAVIIIEIVYLFPDYSSILFDFYDYLVKFLLS